MTVADVLEEGRRQLRAVGVENFRGDARVLLAHVLDTDPARLLLRGHEPVREQELTDYRALIARRAQRYPLQYLSGRVEFFSLEFMVTPDVLIPRTETELLVETALELLAERREAGSEPLVVDLGTGSGAVAVSIAVNSPGCRVIATDLSPRALGVAQENAVRHGVSDRVEFRQGDLWAALASPDPGPMAGILGRIKLVVANPPYVTGEELARLQPELKYEPREALVPPEGVPAFYGRLVAGASRYIRPGGYLALEIGAGQKETIEGIVAAGDWFTPVGYRLDYGGRPRVLVAQRTGKQTRVFPLVGRQVSDPEFHSGIEAAARVIGDGGLVAFPTETVYGLGADGTNPDAVERIFAAKGRPSDNPLILHIATVRALEHLAVDVPWEQVGQLAQAFWPGPLTLVLHRSRLVPDQVTGGLDTVAVRSPSHPVALALIQAAGVALAAPSANRSGRPSPTTAGHVLDDLEGSVDVIIDGGATDIGIESTVLDLTRATPTVLRPGAVGPEALESVLGSAVAVAVGTPEGTPPSPGMKYTHYSPQADLWLFSGSLAGVAAEIGRQARRLADEGRKVAILCSDETREAYSGFPVISLGSRKDLLRVAANLFAALRTLDAGGSEIILSETFPSAGLGQAVMNRLNRAADRVIGVDDGDGSIKGGPSI